MGFKTSPLLLAVIATTLSSQMALASPFPNPNPEDSPRTDQQPFKPIFGMVEDLAKMFRQHNDKPSSDADSLNDIHRLERRPLDARRPTRQDGLGGQQQSNGNGFLGGRPQNSRNVRVTVPFIGLDINVPTDFNFWRTGSAEGTDDNPGNFFVKLFGQPITTIGESKRPGRSTKNPPTTITTTSNDVSSNTTVALSPSSLTTTKSSAETVPDDDEKKSGVDTSSDDKRKSTDELIPSAIDASINEVPRRTA